MARNSCLWLSSGAEYRRLTFAAAELHAEVPEHLLPGVILLCHWPRL